MGREEEREMLAGLRPETVPQIDLDAASGDGDQPAPQVPEADRRGKSDDELTRSAFESGDPDAVPTDITDTEQYQEELTEVRKRAKAE